MAKPTVLITSSTGRIGKELVAQLAQQKNFTVRACYFSDSKAEDLKALGADEIVKFDLNDDSTWAAASGCAGAGKRAGAREGFRFAAGRESADGDDLHAAA